jgi:CRP-like cAMP-binding protein
MGNKFYIVIDGLLVAKNNTEETFYQYYKEGDYFGELALINNRPRQLSVQAVTKCRLVTLTSEVFLSVINRDKANIEIKNKYRDAKPITNIRKKKNTK